jgi:hypothetical protein
MEENMTEPMVKKSVNGKWVAMCLDGDPFSTAVSVSGPSIIGILSGESIGGMVIKDPATAKVVAFSENGKNKTCVIFQYK